MNELCIDANIAVKLVLWGEASRDRARQLVVDCRTAGVALIAPVLFISEVDSSISRRVWEGRLTVAEAQLAYQGLDAVPVQLLDPPVYAPRARDIAIQHGQSRVYDSTYAALAELQNCEFWTADRAFYEAVTADLPFVKLLATYPIP